MSPTDVIQVSARGIDLSSRIVQTNTVAASPAAGAETVIATVTIPLNLSLLTGVILFGWAAFTVGTNGVSARMRIKQTGTGGTTVVDSGGTTGGITAANLVTLDTQGIDTSPPAAGVYALTLVVGSGSAASTVSAVSLVAVCV